MAQIENKRLYTSSGEPINPETSTTAVTDENGRTLPTIKVVKVSGSLYDKRIELDFVGNDDLEGIYIDLDKSRLADNEGDDGIKSLEKLYTIFYELSNSILVGKLMDVVMGGGYKTYEITSITEDVYTYEQTQVFGLSLSLSGPDGYSLFTTVKNMVEISTM